MCVLLPHKDIVVQDLAHVTEVTMLLRRYEVMFLCTISMTHGVEMWHVILVGGSN